MELNGTNGHRIQDSGTKHTGQRLKIVDNGGLHKHTHYAYGAWHRAHACGHSGGARSIEHVSCGFN